MDEGRFNLNGEFSVPKEPFRVAYELRKCNKPIAPSVCICDINRKSVVHPRNKSMQWISAIRLGAVLVGDKIYFTLFGHKYGDSIPTFARSSIPLAAPGSLGNNLDLFKALKKTTATLPSQYESQNLKATYTTYLTLAQLHYGKYFCTQDLGQVIEFFRTYGGATTIANEAIFENCLKRLLKENTKKMRMVKPYLVFLLTPTLTDDPTSIIADYYA